MRIGLVIYGSLETLTGGYLYDRILVDYLQREGDHVEVFSMPWRSYPRHLIDNFSSRWLERLAQSRLDLLVEDELNHPSLFLLNRRLRPQVPYPIISIVHLLRCREQWSVPARVLYETVERWYFQSVDAFIFNSQDTRHLVREILGREGFGVVAYPGGDRLGPVLDEGDITTRVRRGGPLRLAFIGNLIPRKGLDGLLTALACVKDASWELSVAGSLEMDRAYTAKMRKTVAAFGLEDRVRLLGLLSKDELAPLLRGSDILAMPFSYEGFGIVYLEAMAQGLPVLASHSGAAGEVVTHGESGYLFEPGDVEGLATLLRRLINDRDALLRLSVAARRRFAEFPTWEQTAANIRAFLMEAACGSAKA